MASQKIVEAKATVVDEITEVAKNNASFILFDYRGLTAEETSELRKILRESDSKYKVWKNTLTKRALDSLNYNLDDCLAGPSAIAYSSDAIAPIKALSTFAKDHPALEIKGGIVDTVKNSKRTESAVMENQFHTTKLDAENHGRGVRIIRQIVARYDGTVEFTDKGDAFEVAIML